MSYMQHDRMLWITFLTLFYVLTGTVAIVTDTVPYIELDPNGGPDIAINTVLLFVDIVDLNAAQSAKVTTDVAGDTLPCDEAIAVLGSLSCLNTYQEMASQPRISYVLQYNETEQCPDGYEIGVPCDGSALVFDNTVSTDINVIAGGLYDVAWAHQIQPNQPVKISMEFPEAYQVYFLLLDMPSLPIEMIISSSLRDSELVWMRTFQLESCTGQSDKCFKYEYLFYNLVSIDLNPNQEPVTMDKLVIELPAKTTWKDYTINYWLIKEIYLVSTCACKFGECSSEITEGDTRSKAAMYSCVCPEYYSGFVCDECADGAYNMSGTCQPCQCNSQGAFNESCDTNGACFCDSKRFDSADSFGDWNKKCEPYITDVSPLSGPVKGGTTVTITGGLLSQLNLTNCEPTELDCTTDCPNIDTLRECSTVSGEASGSQVTLVNGRKVNGQQISYNFTYVNNYEISGIFPLAAFSSGGRTLTIQGKDLQAANPVHLIFTVDCVLVSSPGQSFPITSSMCEHMVSSGDIHCLSPSFCEVTNECSERGVLSEADNCYEEPISDSIAATIDSVNIEVQIQVDGRLEPYTNYSFNVYKDPVVFSWENSLLQLPADAEVFTVKGDSLDSGADLTEYTVSIDGVKAPPQSINATHLTVMWPSDRPTGSTNVSVGNIIRNVGQLQMETVTAQPNLAAEIVTPIVLFVVLVAVGLPLLWYCLRRKNKLAIEKKFLKMAEQPGNVRYIKHNGEVSFIPLGRLVSDTQMVDQLKPFLIEQERLSLSSQLGAGQFGKVFQGTVKFDDGREMTVAAKTLKADAGVTEEIVCSFLQEATLMCDFDHPNVLTLLGVVYAESSMPIVVLPFMHRGDIRALVHSEDEVFVLGDLLHFCMQIARGMQYLAKRRFIHRDLAARNCMVDNDYVVKIADFGLSHDIYEDDYYRTDENSTKPLPVKWMAVESLNTGKFTTESDVWSYGVVMWELITRGVTPYPLVSNYEIKSHLNGGFRLEQPDYCPSIIYEMMKSCWMTEPKSRPLFSELADKLSDILTESNYEERSKTKNIKSDYYLQETGREDLKQLYVRLAE